MCLKCNVRERITIILNCSHKIYCSKCALKAMNYHEKCPLCRFPVEKLIQNLRSLSENRCRLCAKNEMQLCIISLCMHSQIGFSNECLERWYFNTRNCPVCIEKPSRMK